MFSGPAGNDCFVKITLYRTLLFLSKTWTILAVIVIGYSALYLPRPAESTDYVMTFYVAGHLAASGQATDLYPEPNASSFTGSPFDKAAHALLPRLPQNLTAAYMYSPLVAAIFVPLSNLRPNWSLLFWQGISLIMLAFCCRLLSHLSQAKASDIFFFSFLFFPVFITLWIGQLGIVFGLFPLCVGYLLLTKNRPFLAGIAWSFLSLKPQYLPAVGLVGAALAMVGRVRCLSGLVLGGCGLLGANLILFPWEVTIKWLKSFRVSDAIFSSELYSVPIQLIISLPSNLLMLFPAAQRPLFKLPVYSVAGALWLIGLWRCTNLATAKGNDSSKLPLMVVIGLFLLPLASPHLLYYDLCTYLLAGVILSTNAMWALEKISLTRLPLIAGITISLYFPFFLNVNANVVVPLVLVAILLGFFVVILTATGRRRLGSLPG